MLKINETHMIQMKSAFRHGGEPEKIELTTRGSYVLKNGQYFISYVDSEATGHVGSTTTVKVAQDESRVAVLRFGANTSQLLIQRGQRNLCHYELGYGSITMGVTANEIKSQLTENGGSVYFSYLLDAGSQHLVSENEMEITVTPLT